MARPNQFDRTFCATCLVPIRDDFRGECPICGKPLVPIDYFERLRCDKDLSSFEKKKPWIGIITVAGALALNVLYGLVSFIICITGIKMPYSAIPFLWDPIWAGGAIPLIVTILSSVPLICVPFILKGSCRAINIFLDLSMVSLIGLLFTNLPGCILVFVGGIIAGDMDHKIIYDYSRTKRMKNLFSQKQVFDATEWQCKHCGYINEKRDSECKSGGKYKF